MRIFLVFAFLFLAGCSLPESTLLWQGECLAVYEVRQSRVGITAISHRFEFQGARVTLDQAQVFHQTPYEDSVYGDAPWRLLPGEAEEGVLQTMLYVPTGAMTREQFDAFAACLEKETAALAPVLAGQRGVGPYRLAGLVYGEEDAFVERFVKDQDHVLEIDPDGTVQFVLDGGSAISSGGLADKVQMPGRILLIETPSMISVDELREYRNASDQPVEVRFDVRTAKS